MVFETEDWHKLSKCFLGCSPFFPCGLLVNLRLFTYTFPPFLFSSMLRNWYCSCCKHSSSARRGAVRMAMWLHKLLDARGMHARGNTCKCKCLLQHTTVPHANAVARMSCTSQSACIMTTRCILKKWKRQPFHGRAPSKRDGWEGTHGMCASKFQTATPKLIPVFSSKP